jgi:hypothetical protein
MTITVLQLLIVCNFASGIEYYTLGNTLRYGGAQYVGSVVTGIDGINMSYSIFGDFNPNDFSVNFLDSVFDLRSRNDDDIIDSNIEILNYDGSTATTITDANVSSFGLKDGISYIKCNTLQSTIYGNFLYTINKDEFPNAQDESDGKVINSYGGKGNSNGDYGVGTAWEIDSTTKKFIYGKLPTIGSAADTYIGLPYQVYDDTTDVTASCSFTNDTVTIEGVEYKRGYITYASATNNPLTFRYNVTDNNMAEMIKRLIQSFPGLTYDTTNLNNLKTFFQKRLYWVDKQTDPPASPPPQDTYLSWIYNYQLTGIKIFEDFYKTTGTSYYINENILRFVWIDYSAIEGSGIVSLNESTVINANYETDTNYVENDVTTLYAPDGNGDFFETRNFKFYENVASREVYGYKNNTIEMPFLNDTVQARVATKHYLINHSKPQTKVYINTTVMNAGILNPGNYITLKHPDLKTPDSYRYYIVENVNYSNGNDISVDLIDVENYKNLDNDCKLLIHSWINGSNEFYNDAANSDSVITKVINATYSVTVAGSLAGCMIQGNGTSKMIYITELASPPIADSAKIQSAKWDILQYTDYTIFMEVKFSTVPTSGINVFCDILQVLAADEFLIYFRASDKAIISQFYMSGGTNFACVTNANAIINTDIHQVVFVKVGSTLGTYVDGVQIGYCFNAQTESILGNIYFMGRGNSTYYLDGYLGETYVSASNIFGAAPNVGKTDTITVKTKPFDWYGLNE